MRSRIKSGSVVRDKRDKVWRFYFWENGKRKSKLLGRFATKAAAWEASKPLRDRLEVKPQTTPIVPTVSMLVDEYKAEKMPDRKDTHRTYKSWIHVHILPKWGQSRITDLQARPVEKWLESLPLAPKSRVHIRGILSSLWNYAMWKQAIPMQVNPISLVTVKGASKRVKQPRSLTVEEFQKLCAELHEPHRTIALVYVCFGLRISECLALRWSDVDWLNGRLRVERGIVERNVDDVKTDESRKSLAIAPELLDQLKVWKQATEFPADCHIPTRACGGNWTGQAKRRDWDTWERTHSGIPTGCGLTGSARPSECSKN